MVDSPSTQNPRCIPVWVWTAWSAILSGAMLASCFWPLNLHYLAWIALVPFLVVLPRLSTSGAGLSSWLLALVFYGIGFHWIFKLYGYIGGFIVVGLAALIGVAFYVAKWLIDRLGLASMIFVAAFAFVGQELLRSEGLPLHRFAFLVFGYSQSHNLWIAQLASFGGVYFVSFVLVTVNAAIAYGLLGRRWRSFLPAGVIVLITLILAALAQPPSYQDHPKVAAACVQGEGLPFKGYTQLAAQALEDPLRPAIVVLPEHTIDNTGVGKHTHPVIRSLNALAVKHGSFICSGAEYDAPSGAKCPFENLAILIDPKGTIILKQAKSVPVPFFIDGNPAQKQEVVETPLGRIGVYVCYDATFTDVPRRLVDLGAGLLLGPVMDVKHWPAQERWQHADMAPFRSIELRRCVVRAASSGISQILDATGCVVGQRTQEQGPGKLVANVYFTDDRTIFVRGGYLFATVVGWGFLVSILLVVIVETLKNPLFRRSKRAVTAKE